MNNPILARTPHSRGARVLKAAELRATRTSSSCISIDRPDHLAVWFLPYDNVATLKMRLGVALTAQPLHLERL
jgi:hypothetical protein